MPISRFYVEFIIDPRYPRDLYSEKLNFIDTVRRGKFGAHKIWSKIENREFSV